MTSGRVSHAAFSFLAAACNPSSAAAPAHPAAAPSVTSAVDAAQPATTAPAADAATPAAAAVAPAVDAGCSVCARHKVEWGGTPGLYDVVTYRLAPCNAFGRRNYEYDCAGTLSCDPSRDGSPDAIDGRLAHPDVIAALAHAPVQFGCANELAEGSDGFRLVVDGKEIDVYKGGQPMAPGARCVPPPAGVVAVVEYLQKHPPDESGLTCTPRPH